MISQSGRWDKNKCFHDYLIEFQEFEQEIQWYTQVMIQYICWYEDHDVPVDLFLQLRWQLFLNIVEKMKDFKLLRPSKP